ncbi:LytTR family DNA-binding domain-containing protein [Paenibacillus sp. RU26A]|uniref:LytTR family DNA-binding domain-containing protein n=1 Tax=Paenibacillus sp. RU26A TaxID=1907393 RepID=UPI0009A7DFB3|nr:LytTR family DNA-binding domain-containing protein [Paenibacillus sp. RU26A]SLK16714.1 LytTr DNA-binding domain-containing protein [Paenibacillus sp. RU5A]SOC74444.1 LytTr DNA-binding domain-containing protein [Paenibacillus sp. RU26A]SOC76622.1 LytTr DNA-binding domain-containing protein [Paenibacillus sp. RU5M]
MGNPDNREVEYIDRLLVFKWDEGTNETIPKLINMSDILFFSTDDINGTTIFAVTDKDQYLIRSSLKELSQLPGFYKTDRSYVVNWSQAYSFDPTWNQLIFKSSDKKVNVAGSYFKALKSKILALPTHL